MRPGRLDRILFVGPPDKEGREDILRIRMRTMTVGPDVDVGAIANLVSLLSYRTPKCHSPLSSFSQRYSLMSMTKQTEGCSGAEITSLCQEAAILTMQKDMHAPHVSFCVFPPCLSCLLFH